MESLCLMCRNWLELTLLVVVLNNIGFTSQIPLKSATSDFGPTFHSAICKLENRRQAQEGFSLWIPSLPAREESSSALTGAWEAQCGQQWGTKEAQSPAASPCCCAKGCGEMQSSVFPAWAVLTLTLCSCPQSRSCFRCQALLLALCLEV